MQTSALRMNRRATDSRSDADEKRIKGFDAVTQLLALARSVAALNPNCAEIGAGRLRTLVDDAKSALQLAEEAR